MVAAGVGPQLPRISGERPVSIILASWINMVARIRVELVPRLRPPWRPRAVAPCQLGASYLPAFPKFGCGFPADHLREKMRLVALVKAPWRVLSKEPVAVILARGSLPGVFFFRNLVLISFTRLLEAVEQKHRPRETISHNQRVTMAAESTKETPPSPSGGDVSRDAPDQNILVQQGGATDLEHLPKGYYRSRFFLGSMTATGLGLWAATASFVS
jgi:hypothetical protein